MSRIAKFILLIYQHKKMNELTIADLEVIKTSLSYTKKYISESPDHTYQFKQEQLERIGKVAERVGNIIRDKKDNFLS
jgi:hypothetical protein